MELSEKKCARIHIGKVNCEGCPKISVNDQDIKESKKEKYLGDFLTENANPKETIQARQWQWNSF